MPIEEVVADANVLLSAVVGHAALRVFTDFGLTVHVSEFNADEIARYIPQMARRYDLSPELVEVQWRLLPVQSHPVADYASRLEKAVEDMKDRDPEDAHALALARALRLPLWSNDRDFEGRHVELYPTAKLLALLERG